MCSGLDFASLLQRVQATWNIGKVYIHSIIFILHNFQAFIDELGGLVVYHFLLPCHFFVIILQLGSKLLSLKYGAIVHFGHSEQHGYKFVQQMPERRPNLKCSNPR